MRKFTKVFLFVILLFIVSSMSSNHSINSLNKGIKLKGLHDPIDPLQLVNLFIENPLTFEESLYNKFDRYNEKNELLQSNELVLINGTTNNLENASQTLNLFNTAIIVFSLKSYVSDNISLSSFVGIVSIDLFGNWKFNTSSPNPFVKVAAGSYLYFLAFSTAGGQGNFLVSNTTIIQVPVDNSENDLNGSRGFILPKSGLNLKLDFISCSNFGLSGINHLSSDIKENFSTSNIDLASELTISSYEYDSTSNSSNLLFYQKIFFASWAGEQGITDIVLYVPKNRLISIELIFHSKEAGWVTQIIGPLNTTYINQTTLPTGILSLFIAEKLYTDTLTLTNDIEGEGINIDPYKQPLDEIILLLEDSRNKWLNTKPSFSNRGEILWDQAGIESIYVAELALAKLVRIRLLIDSAYLELTNQPVELYVISLMFVMLISSHLLSQLFFSSRKEKILFQFLLVTIYFLLMINIYPRSEHFLLNKGFFILKNIYIPNFALYSMIYLGLIIVLISNPIKLIDKLKRNSFKTYLDISLRNLKLRKIRTLITVSTLILISASFVLIISVSYKGEIVSSGNKFETSYDGFIIQNIQEISLDFFSFKIETRIPIQAETLLNVTLDLNNFNEQKISLRDHIVDLDTFSSDEFYISINKVNNLTNLPIYSQNKSLGNYWAITPTQEKSISGIDTFITDGRWLNDSFDENNLLNSETLVPSSLAKELNIFVNDSIFYNFSISGIETTAYLKVVGIIDDSFLKTTDITGNPIKIDNYDKVNQSDSLGGKENLGSANGSQFIIMNFNWWRIARAASINAASSNVVNIAQTAPAEILLEPLKSLSSNLRLGVELADRLSPIKVYLAYENQWFNFEWQIIRIVEGILPQLIPLLLSCFIIAQIVINSLWERQEEFELYIILGMRRRNLFTIVISEFFILGLLAGGIGYFLAIIAFPLVKDVFPLVGLNIGSFLTQKFSTDYILLSLIISTGTCIFGSIPVVLHFYKRITPIRTNEDSLIRILIPESNFNDLIAFLEKENFTWSEETISDSHIVIKKIGDLHKYEVSYSTKLKNGQKLQKYIRDMFN